MKLKIIQNENMNPIIVTESGDIVEHVKSLTWHYHARSGFPIATVEIHDIEIKIDPHIFVPTVDNG